MSKDCPDRTALEELLNGTLVEPDAVERHLELCTACQSRLEDLAGMAAVLPGTSLPVELRQADDSRRLGEVIEKLRRNSRPPATATGAPPTDVVPLSGETSARGSATRRPQRIGEYDIHAVLGRGGIGVVYRATDRTLARDVAIKVLRADLADNDALRERFLREARAAAALRHDNVVAIYGVNQHGEQPYLVMEYVPGGSLADRIVRKGKLPWTEVVRLGIELGSSLAAAHARGIIHRDVKPGNVLWDAEAARYKLTDFGLAKAIDEVSLTRTGTLVGTPEYVSPEQAEGAAADARSDLFSLGATLYAAATGQSPFSADSTMGVLHRVRTHMPASLRRARAECPAGLAKIVDRLLAKDPSRRFQTAGDVVEELRRIEGISIAAIQASPRQPHGRRTWALTRSRAVGAAAIVLLLIGAVLWRATRNGEGLSESSSPADTPTETFVVSGTSKGFDTLASAIAAAANDGAIEVQGNELIETGPVRIEGKSLVIRAGKGARPVIVPVSAKAAAETAITTDSDLTIEGLELRWALDDSGQDVEISTGGSIVRSTNGTLRLDHCELVVGRGDACLRLSGASGEIRNSRLSARQGGCVVWRPRAADRLHFENCMLSGHRCISVDCEDRSGDLPAMLEVGNTSWHGASALELVISFAPALPLEFRTSRNLFAVDHMLVMYWPRFGPMSRQAPNIDQARPRLRRAIDWQESENLYGATTRFISYRSPRQPLTAVKDGPADIAQWEAFWNRPGSRSQQGAASAELRGKVGVNEGDLGPKSANP